MVGIAVAEILVDNIGEVARAVVRSVLRTPAVAHHDGLVVLVGIVHNLLERVGQIGARQALHAAEVEVGCRCHTAIGGIGMVVGHADRTAADDDTRATSRRTGVGSVVLTAVVGGEARERGVFLGAAAVVDVSTLQAVVAVGILESDVLEVDTSVDNAKHHARAVVLAAHACLDGIGRASEYVIHVRSLAGCIRGRTHQFRHVDALHVLMGCHSLNLISRDERRHQAVFERTLHLDAHGLQVAQLHLVVQTDERRNHCHTIDGVRAGIDTIKISLVHLRPVDRLQTFHFFVLHIALKRQLSITFVQKHLRGGRKFLNILTLCHHT